MILALIPSSALLIFKTDAVPILRKIPFETLLVFFLKKTSVDLHSKRYVLK